MHKLLISKSVIILARDSHKSCPLNNVTGLSTYYSFQTHFGFWRGTGLAKGNLPQQNASRTPSRKDAPSALERVRQAAGKDKKLRFTALLHHIYNLETLRMAYFRLKKE